MTYQEVVAAYLKFGERIADMADADLRGLIDAMGRHPVLDRYDEIRIAHDAIALQLSLPGMRHERLRAINKTLMDELEGESNYRTPKRRYEASPYAELLGDYASLAANLAALCEDDEAAAVIAGWGGYEEFGPADESQLCHDCVCDTISALRQQPGTEARVAKLKAADEAIIDTGF